MDDYSKLTSIDWNTVIGVLTFLGVVGGAIAGVATRYLNRLIKDGFDGFGQTLSGEYVSKETYNLDSLTAEYRFKTITEDISAINAHLAATDKSIEHLKDSRKWGKT